MQLIFIATIIFILDINKVNAYTAINSDCIDEESCVLLCNYNNKYTSGGSYATGYQSQNTQRNISIYYHFDNKYSVAWESTNTDRNVWKKNPDSFNKIFSNSGTNIYLGASIDPVNFVCPNYGYIDLDGFNGNNELCFDNDGKTCAEEYSNFATQFGTKASKFKSAEKDYDVFADIDNYFENWSYGDISCNELKEVNVDTYINDKFEKDFMTNFLKGNGVPEIFSNYINNNVEKVKNAKKSLSNKKSECIEEINKKESTGEISQEEAEEARREINAIDEEDAVGKLVETVDKTVNEKVVFDATGMNCEGLLGQVDDKNDLAYWLQWCLNVMKYIAIIALLVLSSIDFLKAIVSNDKDAIKKATITTAKRFIFVVLIFFLPIIVEVIMKMFGAYGTCNIK